MEKWFNNEAHGGLYGIYMNQDGLPGCSLIQGFTIWACWDYGIYFQVNVIEDGDSLFSFMIVLCTVKLTNSILDHRESAHL